MALEDIIPLNLLLGKSADDDAHAPVKSGKKKKIDHEAMSSTIMRIPRMDVRVVRDLLDIGIRDVFELQGRAPETLFEEICKLRPDTPKWRIPYLSMAVYFSENDEPEVSMLHPQAWAKS